MDLKKLLGLRPAKTATAAELGEAVARAEAAQQEASARVIELTTQRADVLLAGSAAEVGQHEAALVAARTDAEQAGAMLAALRQRLAATEAEQRRQKVLALVAEAEAAGARFSAFAANEYGGLASKIVAGLRLEMEARRLREEAMTAFLGLPTGEREGVSLAAEPVLPPNAQGFTGSGIHAHGLGAFVRLPAANGDETGNHWPFTPWGRVA